ncbi:YqeG family HAD IIIA-type phosphatase [Lachnoclostridium sp. Marseille-P6806]|uniref:YqeG family HAD IIIA-type phosphatase n=1 Tax=Lachnoclostridium sp. Marseille-P6806 TaxID=2364793 RepID=UPI00102FC598|nr:YqeG family HAD IIIA-type phosphatase [Lachnoclostridium sp. Marseille-P6806]
MNHLLFPNEIVPSAYHIDYGRLYDEGFRAVIYDIDNTLVPHGALPDGRAAALFAHLHSLGMKAALVSNNKEPRVRRFAEAVDASYVAKAHKPSPSGYRRAMELMGTDRTNTLFVGDQIFTDVLGARRAGLYSVLTRPIHPREEIQIIVKRLLEKPVLWSYSAYRRRHPLPRGESVLLPGGEEAALAFYGAYSGETGSLRSEKRNGNGQSH